MGAGRDARCFRRGGCITGLRPKPNSVDEMGADSVIRCRGTTPLPAGPTRDARMTPDPVTLAVDVILLFPMGFFLLSSPAFLLVKLDIPEVTTLLRGLFSVHFLMLTGAGIIGMVAFALAGRPVLALGVGLVAAVA